MIYKTHVTRWTKELGEYEQETQTPDEISKYKFYDRIETREKPLKLFAIGGTAENGYSSNWDIYADTKGTLYSIPRKGSGANGSYFGDKKHIQNLQRQGHFHDTLTEYGKQIMTA